MLSLLPTHSHQALYVMNDSLVMAFIARTFVTSLLGTEILAP